MLSLHWLKLQHSDWRDNLAKDFPIMRALEYITGHEIYNPANNVCPVKIRSKRSSVLLLCLLRIFTGQTLLTNLN